MEDSGISGHPSYKKVSPSVQRGEETHFLCYLSRVTNHTGSRSGASIPTGDKDRSPGAMDPGGNSAR